MYKTTKRLQTDYMKACFVEFLRKKLVDHGEYSLALKTYLTKKYLLSDLNSGKFWDEKFSIDRLLNPMEKWRTNKIISLIKAKSKILNIGVGSGRLEEILFRTKDTDYVGTDITNKTLNVLKKKFPGKIFLGQTLPKLNFGNDKFDQVMLLEVLEHIKPTETFILLKEIYRILKVNGEFVVSVPINEGLEKMLPDNPNSHMRMYSEELLKFELKVAGFEIEKVFSSTAFDKMFTIKHILNSVYPFRHSNNIIILCSKK